MPPESIQDLHQECLFDNIFISSTKTPLYLQQIKLCKDNTKETRIKSSFNNILQVAILSVFVSNFLVWHFQ